MEVADQEISPHKVTKPIQLLAAWLVGLSFVNGSFLSAAVAWKSPGWEQGALTIAAILNVPLFLGALFILQTKFRAELQEDAFYHQYLNKKTDKFVQVSKLDLLDAKITSLENNLQGLSEKNPTWYRKTLPLSWIGKDGTLL